MAVVPYRAADRHRAHRAHARGEVRNQYRRAVARVALKALCNDRVLLHLLLDRQHALHDAGHPDGIVIGLDIVLGAVVDAADDAAFDQLVYHRLRVLDARAGFLGYLLNMSRLAHLDVHAHIGHLVRDHGVEYHILGVGRSDAGVGAGLEADFGCKEKYLFSEGHISPSFHIKKLGYPTLVILLSL